MRTPLCAILPVLLALTACDELFGDQDAYQPGNPLGTFHVVGTRTSNSCGEGALGTGPTWEFDVDLARDDGVLFWDNGASVVQGTLDDDNVTFSIDATVAVDMRTEEAPGPPCSVERRDAAQGVLDDTDDGVSGFSATLAYDFTPTAGSRCEDLVDSAAPLFARLPCHIAYGLAAERTKAPE